MKFIVAHELYGGGACPTQFYFHNNKTKWYYFRYRSGKWFLKSSYKSIEECSPEEYLDCDTIDVGYEGNEMDGYCTLCDMVRFLRKQDIIIVINDIKEADYLCF